MQIVPNDDLSWPRTEPDRWRGFDCTRKDIRAFMDAIGDYTTADVALYTALDEIQGRMNNIDPNDVAYLLIKITKPEL